MTSIFVTNTMWAAGLEMAIAVVLKHQVLFKGGNNENGFKISMAGNTINNVIYIK